MISKSFSWSLLEQLGQNKFRNKICTKSNCNFLQKNYDDFVLRMGKSASTYDLNTISDVDVRRKIIKLKSQIGTNILEGDDLNKYKKLVNQMITIYSTAKGQEISKEFLKNQRNLLNIFSLASKKWSKNKKYFNMLNSP